MGLFCFKFNIRSKKKIRNSVHNSCKMVLNVSNDSNLHKTHWKKIVFLTIHLYFYTTIRIISKPIFFLFFFLFKTYVNEFLKRRKCVDFEKKHDFESFHTRSVEYERFIKYKIRKINFILLFFIFHKLLVWHFLCIKAGNTHKKCIS